MIDSYYRFGMLIALFFCSLYAHTILAVHKERIFFETSSIADVLFYEQPATLFVFDLDNTLVWPQQSEGSDQWVTKRIKDRLSLCYSPQKAFELTFQENDRLQEVLTLFPVEKNTRYVLNKLSRDGFQTIGLTARSLVLTKRTIKQLRDAGISFNPKELDRDIKGTLKRPFRLCHGILFCDGKDKGEALLYILRQCDYKPARIVFTDDKIAHLREVADACAREGIAFSGIRYANLDKVVKRYLLD